MPRTAAHKTEATAKTTEPEMKPMIRKLTRLGRSMVVTLPPAVLERLGVEAGDHLRIDYDAEGERIIITAVQL